MSRTKIDLNTKLEVALIPMSTVLISQGAGTTKDGITPLPTSQYNGTHMGYKAIDFCDSSRVLYAPFSLVCVDHKFLGNAHFSFFRSKNKVLCADNSQSYISLVCIHGGQFISVTATNKQGEKYTTNLSKDIEIAQGDIFYRQGSEGLLSSGIHAHVNAIKGLLPDNFNFYDYFYDYSQTNISNVEWTKASGFKNDSYLEDIFFLLKDDKVDYELGTGYLWRNHINFKTYSSSGKLNGWIALGEYWYYYIEDVKKTGWLEDPANSAKWFYLDPLKNGAMATGWLKLGNIDYYMNPANGQSGHDVNLPGGQMTRSKWVASGTKWYYIKESGEMANNEWLASGSNWFYLKAGGAMAVSEWVQTKADGRCYFDANGYWVRNA